MHMQSTKEQRPLGELFAELAGQTATLVREEVALVKVETTAKLRTAGVNAAQIAAGGAVLMLGAQTLLAAAVLVLALAIPFWAAALLVGIAVTILGGVLVARGLKAFERFDAVPRETLRTLQEDKQWLKEQVSR